ncbi:MAG: M23 family metallopeptidase [Bacteroidota bacterium]
MAISFPPTDRPLAPPPPKPRPWKNFLWGLLIGFAGFGTAFYFLYESPVIKDFFTPPVRPYGAYVSNLERSQLAETVMGKTWLEVGRAALEDTLLRQAPFLDAGYFSADEPRALSYFLRPQRGQELSIDMELSTPGDSPQVFIELFAWDETRRGGPQLVAYADSGRYHLQYDVSGNEAYILRIQPALLTRFSFRVKVWYGPSLSFPVAGKDSKAIRSFWGDSRDGGRRRHKGIDIFSRKGTPVLAAANGRISRVRNGGLGGKVVWQRDAEHPQSLYYAHLDTQWVRRGELVEIGDTLGLVGNTGNARTTPPHLHFGIYQRNRGAVDPYPFVHIPVQTPPTLEAKEEDLLQWYRITQPTALQSKPAGEGKVVMILPEDTPVRRLAATGRWHQISLPNGQQGYIPHQSSQVASYNQPIQRWQGSHVLLDQPTAGVAMDSLTQGDSIRVLGTWEGYQWVMNQSRQEGWVKE